jgi:Protein of unknown function (DUF2796)
VNMRSSVSLLLCAGVALASDPACAQPPIQHRPHVHGATIVDVAQDGRDLTVSFELSGLDAVGFEHTPKSDADQSRVNAALVILQSPDDWLIPNAEAHCLRTFIGVTPHIFQTPHEDEPHHAAKESRRHDYADIGAQYSFTCDVPLRLRTLEFDLIDRFPKLRGIIVNLMLPGAQSQAVITAPRAQITFASAAADD